MSAPTPNPETPNTRTPRSKSFSTPRSPLPDSLIPGQRTPTNPDSFILPPSNNRFSPGRFFQSTHRSRSLRVSQVPSPLSPAPFIPLPASPSPIELFPGEVDDEIPVDDVVQKREGHDKRLANLIREATKDDRRVRGDESPSSGDEIKRQSSRGGKEIMETSDPVREETPKPSIQTTTNTRFKESFIAVKDELEEVTKKAVEGTTRHLSSHRRRPPRPETSTTKPKTVTFPDKIETSISALPGNLPPEEVLQKPSIPDENSVTQVSADPIAYKDLLPILGMVLLEALYPFAFIAGYVGVFSRATVYRYRSSESFKHFVLDIWFEMLVISICAIVILSTVSVPLFISLIQAFDSPETGVVHREE